MSDVVKQHEDMLYLQNTVVVLAPLLGLTPEATVVVQELAGFPSTASLKVTNATVTYQVFGGHLLIWARNAGLEGTNYIDFAMRSIFGRFIPGLGQTKWKTLLRKAGFETGQLPEDF